VSLSLENMFIPVGLLFCNEGGETKGPFKSEVPRRGRGRRAGQTTRRETMKHGRPAILRRPNTGLGQNRKTMPRIALSRTTLDVMKPKRVVTSGTRGEVEPSRRGRKGGSLSAPIVPMESRRTEKRRELGSREGGRPRAGPEAGKHTLGPLRI